MRRTLLALVSLVIVSFVAPSFALAQAAPASTLGARSTLGRGLGLGAVESLGGMAGALVTWGEAGGRFHVDGIIGLSRGDSGGTNVTDFNLGGRFWYHVHSAAAADFSVGGGAGIISSGARGPNGDRSNDLCLELGANLRAFLVSNVALVGSVGMGIFFGDSDHYIIGGQLFGGATYTGTLGIAYFFE